MIAGGLVMKRKSSNCVDKVCHDEPVIFVHNNWAFFPGVERAARMSRSMMVLLIRDGYIPPAAIYFPLSDHPLAGPPG